MDLLVNELSVHEQFNDSQEFHTALIRLMKMRKMARSFGKEIVCNRSFVHTFPIAAMPMKQAINRCCSQSERRAIMAWLDRQGPFWEDDQCHENDDFLECGGKIVTETTVGEAAFRSLHGSELGLVSLTPSNWNFCPVIVTWYFDESGQSSKIVKLQNWWSRHTLYEALKSCKPQIKQWNDLHKVCDDRFDGLTFAENWLKPLEGEPFVKSVADRFIFLLNLLSELTQERDHSGKRTEEGHRIHQDHFVGSRASFSDSSETEKQRFRQDLTFKHPVDPGKTIFCTWHGKVSHRSLRLHFSSPTDSEKQIYVVYAGPKITKR